MEKGHCWGPFEHFGVAAATAALMCGSSCCSQSCLCGRSVHAPLALAVQGPVVEVGWYHLAKSFCLLVVS